MRKVRPELLYWDTSRRLTYLVSEKMVRKDRQIQNDLEYIISNNESRNISPCNK
jgi:hypothetical protein